MQNLSRIGAFLLCITVLLCTVSCSALQKVGSQTTDPVDPGKLDPDQGLEALNLNRRPNQITLLLAVEGSSAGTLSAIDLISLDDSGESPAIHVLQIPADTFVRSGGTLSGYFSNAYLTSVADGHNEEAAAESAMASLRSLIQNSLMVSVDYSVHLTREGLGKIIDTVGGVTLEFAYPISVNGHGLNAGKQTVSGADAAALYDYTGFSENFNEKLNISKHLLTAATASLKSNIDKSILALCVLEMKEQMTTDIPSTGGSDVFLIRRLMETSFENLSFTCLSSKSVTLASGECRVLCKVGALEQINSFINLYKEPLTEEEFDPNSFFNGNDNIVKTIYSGSAVDEEIVTAAVLRDGNHRIS
ncbi:MAG: LCP family protein [Eubacteriales bacterium]